MIVLHDNEKVIVSVRKHWIVFVVESFSLIVAALLPLLILPFIDNIFGDLGDKTYFVIFFILFAWELALWLVFYVAFTNYYLDKIVLTDKRVLDIEQLGLFSRDLATIPINNVQDVKIEIKGVLATLFRYGNIYIQTAGSSPEVVIRGIRKPKLIKDIILNIHNRGVQAPKEQG